MEQKNLTTEQKVICEELKAIMEKAEQAGIHFVFDLNDYLLSAYNGDGINYLDSDYSALMRYETDNKFDWTKSFNLICADYVNSNVEDVFINFED